jgi:phosphoketolase
MQQAASKNGELDVLNERELSRLDAFWRAANYVAVGQILSARQSTAPRATEARAYQAVATGTLGHNVSMAWCSTESRELSAKSTAPLAR